MAARQTALGALIACRKQGAWSDGVLKEYAQRDRLDRRDAALATRLCYGVLQNRMLLDFYLSQLVRGRLRDLQPVVLDILRLGLYQIFYMDKIPDSAAVHEAVEQGKQYANPRAAGLVNGVLRGAIRRRGELAEPRDLATRYSHPQPLVELLAGEMGPEELEGVLAADNQAPETVLQGNPLAGDWSQIPAAIQAAGGSCTPHPWLERCFLIAGAGNLERLEIYQKGLCYVQDAASRLAVQCAGVKPGMQVLDSCAAPGGKSFAAAIDMAGHGKGSGPDGPSLHTHPAPGRPGAGSGVGGRHGSGPGGCALQRPGDHPEEAGHPIQGSDPDGEAPPAADGDSLQASPVCEARRCASLLHLHHFAPGKPAGSSGLFGAEP